jgi:splicing factor 3B subunit 3
VSIPEAEKRKLIANLNIRLTKVSLVSGGRDVLVYTTISGAVGALVPFASTDDVEFMTTLEMVCFSSTL